MSEGRVVFSVEDQVGSIRQVDHHPGIAVRPQLLAPVDIETHGP